MFNEIYTGFTIALASALFVFGVFFRSLCGNIESPVFRTALRMMTFTYCFFGVINLLELWSRFSMPATDDVMLFRITTLIVAVSQAFLFTYTLILLIHDTYVTRQRVVRELVPIVTLSAAFVGVWFIVPAERLNIPVWLFTLFYLYLLIKYTRLFIITYHNCLRKMDNYFSGQEAQNLRWVHFSFFAALSIGVLALTASMFPAIHIGIACSVVYLLFYVYFAIRFINYSFVFRKMEAALSDGGDILPEQPDEETGVPQTSAVNTLEINLQKWLDRQQFLQSGITIEDVAIEIGTNRRYLSEHINSTKGKNFRQWINELRIAEAKILLRQHPEMTMSEIASMAGFANKSHFGRIFLAFTQSTPQNWRTSITV